MTKSTYRGVLLDRRHLPHEPPLVDPLLLRHDVGLGRGRALRHDLRVVAGESRDTTSAFVPSWNQEGTIRSIDAPTNPSV